MSFENTSPVDGELKKLVSHKTSRSSTLITTNKKSLLQQKCLGDVVPRDQKSGDELSNVAVNMSFNL